MSDRGPPSRPAAETGPLVCLAGPTASGKSAIALAFADAAAAAARAGRGQPVEIVSVDSALVYRGMDIGTAKPTAAERRAVPHHLIDIVEPSERYSAARFCADARAAVDAIRARGARPLLVGGTMLYVKALRDGLDALPEADSAVRAALEARARRDGWPALHRELAAIDPATAAQLAPNDAQRIQRALEVHALTGRTLSSLQTRRQASGEAGVVVVSLEPRERAWLHARIEARFDAMLAAGFVDEVRALRARGDLGPELPSMRAVGYRQAWQALESGDLSGLRASAIAATRRLAKHQLTWLRSWPHRRAIDCDAPDASERAMAALEAAFGDAEGDTRAGAGADVRERA